MKSLIIAVGLASGFVAMRYLWAPAPPPVSCYEIVSVRPEQHAVLLFNACTGDIEERFLALPPASNPAPQQAPQSF